MPAKAALNIDITADASDAVAAFDKAGGAVKDYGNAAEDTAKKSRDVSGGIEETGGAAASVTTGLRDLGGAMSECGGIVGQMGNAMVVGATAFEAMDGAATLYAGAQQFATLMAGGFTKAMNIMKVAILTNPIFIIAAVIIAIAIAFVLLWKNCETFREIVTAAFNAVWGVIKNVWNWIKANWPLLLAILTGPIGIAVLVISRNWDTIKDGAQAVFNWIKGVWSTLTGILSAPFNAAWDVISGILASIKHAIQSVIDTIKKIKFPKLPDLNPFNASASAAGFAAPRVGVASAAPAARASSGGVTINVHGALDAEGTARQIRRILAAHDVRGGRAVIGAI